MGRVFMVELEGRANKCKFCKTYLALADDLVSRCIDPWLNRRTSCPVCKFKETWTQQRNLDPISPNTDAWSPQSCTDRDDS